MITLLRPLIIPPLLSSGQRSTCKMKPVSVQIFNKDDKLPSGGGHADEKVCGALRSQVICPVEKPGQKSKGMQPLHVVDLEQPKSEGMIFHENRVAARKEILDEFACLIHSLPDKPMACWKDPVQNICYPLTEHHLNLWATLHVHVSSARSILLFIQ